MATLMLSMPIRHLLDCDNTDVLADLEELKNRSAAVGCLALGHDACELAGTTALTAGEDDLELSHGKDLRGGRRAASGEGALACSSRVRSAQACADRSGRT